MALNIKEHKKGSALYLVIAMLVILLPLALGLTTIIVGQLAITRDMGYSVVAFYAADAGIENSIIEWRTGTAAPIDIVVPVRVSLGSEAYYTVSVEPAGGDCVADHFCVQSIGQYQGIHRSIEINF